MNLRPSVRLSVFVSFHSWNTFSAKQIIDVESKFGYSSTESPIVILSLQLNDGKNRPSFVEVSWHDAAPLSFKALTKVILTFLEQIDLNAC